MTVKLTLTVNGSPIKTDYFVEGFVDHTVSGMVEALEDTGKFNDLELTVEGEEVGLTLNGAKVRTNEFVQKIVKATLFGMVSVLKGVDQPKTLKIKIQK